MRNIKLFIILIFLISQSANTFSQKSDTLKTDKIVLKSILPVSLITIGSLISGSIFEKNMQTNLRNKVGNNYEFKIDNYLQYTPIAEIYIADLIGIKSKNHWFDQTKYLVISNIITSVITHTIKNTVNKTRPNGENYSFPSGHTSFAFNNATILYYEFRKTSPIIAYSGFAFAATTGTFRMINNKHWFSDVLAGAGIGILVTNLVYHFEPFKNFNPFIKSKNITFFPNIENNFYGFYFSYSINP